MTRRIKRAARSALLFAIIFSLALGSSGCIEAVIYSFEAEGDLSVEFTNEDEFYCYGDRSLFSADTTTASEPYKLTEPEYALDVALTDTTAVFLTTSGLYATGVPADLPFEDSSTVALTEPVRFVYEEWEAKRDSSARYVPVDLSTAEQVVSGGDFTLVRLTDGTVYGWGANSSGQLGESAPAHCNYPVKIEGLEGVSSIAAGYSGHICAAIDMDGHVHTWGGLAGGDYAQTYFEPPSAAVEVVCTNSVVAVLTADAEVYQIKYNLSGLEPEFRKLEGLPLVYSLVGGEKFFAAKDGDGNVWTWGHNDEGQLGRETKSDGGYEMDWTPAMVEGLTGVVSLSAGRAHVMAMTQNMTIYLWGSNSSGQLGVDPAEVAYSLTPLAAPKINQSLQNA